MDTIGKRLRYLRKINNLSLTEVNKITGLSTGNLSELENDKFLPSSSALIRFKKLYNISIDWLLLGKAAPSYAEAVEEESVSYSTDEEIELIELYRKLDDEEKRDIVGYLRTLILMKENR